MRDAESWLNEAEAPDCTSLHITSFQTWHLSRTRARALEVKTWKYLQIYLAEASFCWKRQRVLENSTLDSQGVTHLVLCFHPCLVYHCVPCSWREFVRETVANIIWWMTNQILQYTLFYYWLFAVSQVISESYHFFLCKIREFGHKPEKFKEPVIWSICLKPKTRCF